MKALLLCIYLFCIKLGAGQDPCQNGWERKNNFCYFVGESGTEVDVSWYEARSQCNRKGGDLASIEDKDINNFLTKLLGTKKATQAWIGMNKLGNGRTFKWADGSKSKFRNFQKGSQMDGDEWCAFLNGPDNDDLKGVWSIKNCVTTRNFICKSDGRSDPIVIPPTVKIGGYCPKGWLDYENKCFLIVNKTVLTGKTWANAEKECKNMNIGVNSNLATFHSTDEHAFVVSQIQRYSHGMWIGMRRTDGNWQWCDNTPVDYTAWQPGVNLNNPDKDCSELVTFPGPPGSWRPEGCTQDHHKRGWICQTYKDSNSIIVTPPSTTPNSCPPGYTPYWYACYKLYAGDTTKTWVDAESHCAAEGSHLVSIHSAPENAAAYVLANFNFPFWIGLYEKDGENDGEYVWTDGWATIYTSDLGLQPSSSKGGFVMNKTGSWVQISDETRVMPFMCKWTRSPPITTPAPSQGVCPDESWRKYGSFCYKYMDTWSTFENAATECQNSVELPWDPHLVSIHSHFEDDFLYKYIKENNQRTNVWIGLSKTGAGRSYGWIDGSEFNYEAWAPDEPNDKDGTENCVEMLVSSWPGLWNDHQCTQARPFVCKTKLAPKPTPPPTPASIAGKCPGKDWISYGKFCFYLKPDARRSQATARILCNNEGTTQTPSSLASIRDKAENDNLRNTLREISNFNTASYIGLVLRGANKFIWLDGTVYDESKAAWANDEPSFSKPSEPLKSCVQISHETGLWSLVECNARIGFACRCNKVLEQTGLSAGGIVGVVFAVIIAVTLIALLVLVAFKKREMIEGELRRRFPRKTEDDLRKFDGIDNINNNLSANSVHNESFS